MAGVFKCNFCNEAKELQAFEKSNSKRGHRVTCKECRQTKAKIYRQTPEGKAKKRAADKAYREKNKAKTSAYFKEYYEENKDDLQRKGRDWREKNKDTLKIKTREYYLKNKQTISEQATEYKRLKRLETDVGQFKHKNKTLLEKGLKACPECLEVLPTSCFKNQKSLRSRCSDCKRIAALRSYHKNKNTPKRIKTRQAYKKSPAGMAASMLSHSKRRAAKRSAVPSWTTKEDSRYIRDLYQNCREAEDIFGDIGINIKFHVDHIIPLVSGVVCGLHHPDNLQILSAEDNMKKRNKFCAEEV